MNAADMFDGRSLKVKTVADAIGIGPIRFGVKGTISEGLWWRGPDHIWRSDADVEVLHRTRELLGDRWRPSHVKLVIAWCKDPAPFRASDWRVTSEAEFAVNMIREGDLSGEQYFLNELKYLRDSSKSARREALYAIVLAKMALEGEHSNGADE